MMLHSRKIGKSSKLFCLFLVLTLLLSATTLMAGAAGNYHDTLFEASADTYAGELETVCRNKLDSSSSYAYNMKSSCAVTAFVYGCAYAEGHPNALPYFAYNCTYGSAKTIPVGAAYYLPNLVKERGYQSACLIFNFPSGWNNLYIWWSPDSV